MKSGFKLTVEGQYFVKTSDKGKILKQYKFQINLPSMDRALSIIKHKILKKVLPKLYSDYFTYRTHFITNVEPFGEAEVVGQNIWQMNEEKLKNFIQDKNLPIKLRLYPTLLSLRQAIELAVKEPDRFLFVQDRTEKTFEEDQALISLNPELFSPELTKEEAATDASLNPDTNLLDKLDL